MPKKRKIASILRRTGLAFLLIAVVSSNTTAANEFDLQEFHGKVIVLDFWASWCVPCSRSFPWMNSMQEKYADDGLVIIAVNMDSDAADADRFLQNYPAEFEVIFDPDGELAREYDVVAMPSSYVHDRNGELLERHLGFKVRSQDEYEAILIDALQDTQIN